MYYALPLPHSIGYGGTNRRRHPNTTPFYTSVFAPREQFLTAGRAVLTAGKASKDEKQSLLYEWQRGWRPERPFGGALYSNCIVWTAQSKK